METMLERYPGDRSNSHKGVLRRYLANFGLGGEDLPIQESTNALSCECLCSICSLDDLATSFDLHLPLFNCLCESHVLMHVSIISHSLHNS